MISRHAVASPVRRTTVVNRAVNTGRWALASFDRRVMSTVAVRRIVGPGIWTYTDVPAPVLFGGSGPSVKLFGGSSIGAQRRYQVQGGHPAGAPAPGITPERQPPDASRVQGGWHSTDSAPVWSSGSLVGSSTDSAPVWSSGSLVGSSTDSAPVWSSGSLVGSSTVSAPVWSSWRRGGFLVCGGGG